MFYRLTAIVLTVALILSSLPIPVTYAAPAVQESSQDSPETLDAKTLAALNELSVRGEIAYVLGGDIWLLNLSNGQSRQLTDSGDAQLPAWSPDGRYLTYSRGPDLERADLYILDMASGESRLLVSDACCAGWETEPGGARIAFLAQDQEELRIDAILPDGSARETLLDPFTYGLGLFPTGRVLWVGDESDLGEFEGLSIPVEFIDRTPDGNLFVYSMVMNIKFDQELSRFSESMYPFPEIGEAIDCGLSGMDIHLGSGTVAWAMPGPACTRSGANADRFIWVFNYHLDTRGYALPWWSYPSFAPEGGQLVAEHYVEADDPLSAPLRGLALYDLETDTQVDLVPDAAQPAWRPEAPVDEVAAQLAEPDERVVTIERGLHYQAEVYHVSYFTTGDYARRDTGFFADATPGLFDAEGITGIAVTTESGQSVTDLNTIREVLLLFRAAYYLYEDQPGDQGAEYMDDLHAILHHPIFASMTPIATVRSLAGLLPGDWLGDQEGRTTEFLRGMLTDQVSAQSHLKPVFDDFLQRTPDQASDALDIFQEIVDDKYAQNVTLGLVTQDLSDAVTALDKTIFAGQHAFLLFQLAARLLSTSHLQSDRVDWLDEYVSGPLIDASSFNRSQLRAAVLVMAELDNLHQQRINVLEEFLTEYIATGLYQMASMLTVEGLSRFSGKLAAKYGGTAALQKIAAVLSPLGAGLTANRILYGGGDLVTNFRLAETGDELRATFAAGRYYLQELAADRDPNDAYAGFLASRFRTAYLLETLAATQGRRHYADGIAATFRLPNPAQLINWLTGQDYRAVVDDDLAYAAERELRVLEQMAAPAFIDRALELNRSYQPSTYATAEGDEILIPAGPFQMGCDVNNPAEAGCNVFDWQAYELPLHTVTLDEYYIDAYPVTNARYQACEDAGVCMPPWITSSHTREEYYGNPDYADYPVIWVDWFQAEAFCAWEGKRLPTEAEWEKAARGPDDTRKYPWGDEAPTCELANFWGGEDGCIGDTSAVGSYPAGASPYGVMDMAGNVREWVHDRYDFGDYSGSPAVNPQGPAEGEIRIVRGGSWPSNLYYVRAALRDWSGPTIRIFDRGFRCVRSP